MAKLTAEKLDEFRQALEDLGEQLTKLHVQVQGVADNIEEVADNLSELQDEADKVDYPEEDALETEAKELADKVAPEEEKKE